MRSFNLTAAALSVLSALPAVGHAQAVTIPNTDPPTVVSVLKADLATQGFVLDHAGKKDAVFTLDRGTQIQPNHSVVHVHIEVHTWFKQKGDSLVVTVKEEVVGEGNSAVDLRRTVDTPPDLQRLQEMLDSVKHDVMSRADSLARDSSAAKRDTTH